ncbi:MAG TPA: pyridoxal phosphate-dependent aminotransferase [Gammaproteobacteria bacterium]|nr:pyridoxal phosphate-dependent aminotransferase [Gammaproteobacteria bacterium]
MHVKLADRALTIKPSPTLSVSARAAALKAAGKAIISLAAGEPDFDTPEPIKAAAIQAIQEGFTKYTAVEGTPGLRRAIAAKLKRENTLDYTPEQILVSAGCKHSIYNLLMALLNPGDEVIISAPYWASYPDMVKLTGAEPVIIKTGLEDNFKINQAQLEAAITPKTRLLILNSPSNPTGEYYTREALLKLGEVLLEHPGIVIASDDIYEHILWHAQPFANILNACPTLYDRTVVLNGVSKAYAMTGWRIGYAAGPKPLIQAMADLQSQSTSNPTSIAQIAAQAALEGDQGSVREQCKVFKQRHDFVYTRLNQLKGVKCLPAQGTFYVFPTMEGVIAGIDGVDEDIALAEYFLEKAGLAMVPGSAFGAPGYMRLSFATSLDNLKRAMDRLEGLLGKG